MRIVKFSCVALAIALVAACGNNGSAKSSPPTVSTTTVAPLTKAAYVARANAICQRMNRRVNAIADPGNDPAKLVVAFHRIGAYIDSTLVQLRALPAPAGDGPQLSSIYAKVAALRRGMDVYVAALRARDRLAAAAAIRRVNALGNAADAASNKYGLKVCGSS